MDHLTEPLVSVVMNCYNAEKYLKKAMDSVFKQTYKNWEIIFFDNASTDNSAEIARSYGEKVKYYRSDKTYPLGDARNLALEKVNGEYIAFLDCDDVWNPEKLERQTIEFEKDKDLGFVFSDAYYTDETDNVGDRILKYVDTSKIKGPFDILKRGVLIVWSMIMIRKKILDRVGLFNPELMFCEDDDMIFKLAFEGPFKLINEPLGCWRYHSTNLTSNINFKMKKKEKVIVLRNILETKKLSILEKIELRLFIYKTIMTFEMVCKIFDKIREYIFRWVKS
ncbi:MAG: glycosyltransferase [Candidatus Hydrogenedentota bacterium]